MYIYIYIYIYICTKCTLFSNTYCIAAAAAVKRALTFRLTAWKYFCLIPRDAAGQFHSLRRCWKIDAALRDFMTYLTGNRVSGHRRYNLIASCERAAATSCTLQRRKNDEKNDKFFQIYA